MFLKYIEIQGFKSFPDKTRIKFDRVLTGIVGPNGSGKSNISDAVRWVLGEQSSKSLRGGKMEDVIFNGTVSTRKPMGFAQVSLCLDNSDGKIADMGEQILVTRRYYRSGDSEYSINGAAVRLKEIREMFMDTGLGRDGYSVIGQGRISEVVDSKPSDRREVFEEASGIAKFRFRKNDAERKLSQTEDNLDRLRDIASTYEERLGPLRDQSEKAKRFLEFSAMRKGLEITLYSDTIRRSKENLRKQQENLRIAQLDYAGVEEKMSGLDAEIETLQEASRSEEALSGQYQEAVEERNSGIAELESSVAVINNDIMHARRQIEEYKQSLETLSKDDEGIKADIEEKNLESSKKKVQAEALRENISSLEKEMELLISDSAKTDMFRSETAAKIAEIGSELADLRMGLAADTSTLEALSEREDSIKGSISTQNDGLETIREEAAKVASYLEKLESDISDAENAAQGYRMKLESRQGKRQALEKKLSEVTAEINKAEQTAAVLRNMESSMEGYYPPVVKVIEASRKHELGGIVGTVSSILSVEKGMETAIETALGAAMQNIVTENEKAARDGIDLLNRSKAGRATFIPLDTVRPSRFTYRERLDDEGVVGLASDLVKYEPRYSNVVSFLLGRIVIAEDLTYASRIAKKAGYAFKIVTKDGQVINGGGTYTGGSSPRRAESFSRRADIEALEEKVKKLTSASQGDRSEKQRLDGEVASLTEMLDTLIGELSSLREDKIRADAEAGRLSAQIRLIEDSNATGEAELERIAQTRSEKRSAIAAAEGRISVLCKEEERLNDMLLSSDSADGFMERRSALMETLTDRRVELAELVKDYERLDASVEEMSDRGERGLERVSFLESEITRVNGEIERMEGSLSDIASDIATRRENVESLRSRIQECYERRNENDQKVSEIRKLKDDYILERENIAGEQARLEEKSRSLEDEYQSSVTKLWEEYELTPAEAEPLCVEFTGITELRSQVNSVRAKIRALGSVNVGAIDEYVEVSEKYSFLTTQIGDVEESKKQLLDLIDKLETEMKQLFTASFNQINEKFHNTFVQMFGGGKANLYLTDENDILGSGIELDVQPPGKVVKNLAQLSGGEKALVAIAIYVAILEVNPSPFCILDEIDSALDESNVVRFARYIKQMTDNTQMITITHRRGTMEEADVLYGVTMQEEGVSMVLRLDVDEAQVLIAGDKANS